MAEHGLHTVADMHEAVGLRTLHAIKVDDTLLERFLVGIDEPGDNFGNDDVSFALFYSVLMRGPAIWQPIAELLPPNGVDGGGNWSFYALPTLGTTVHASTEITKVEEKVGKRGPLVIITARTEWHADGVLLAACDASAIFQ